jgi:hypothetical protein
MGITFTPSLNHILSIIGMEDFNDMVITWVSGDDDAIRENLYPENESDNYLGKLLKEGYTDENFPYGELDLYCDNIKGHLKNNLILPF